MERLPGGQMLAGVETLRVLVYDREGSQASQNLLKRFQSSQYFKVVGTVNSYRDLTYAIDDGDCQLGIVIPHDFSQTLADGRPAAIQAIVDGTDQNTAQIAIGYAQVVIGGYSQAVQAQYFARNRLGGMVPAITVQQRTWFNEDLESKNFIVPGVAAVVKVQELSGLRAIVDAVRVNDDIVAYVVDLVRATRGHPSLQFGASPRAAAMLASSARALAAFEGRDFVIPDDIKRLAQPALRHRLILAPSAEIEGQSIDGVLAQIVERQAAPR